MIFLLGHNLASEGKHKLQGVNKIYGKPRASMPQSRGRGGERVDILAGSLV